MTQLQKQLHNISDSEYADFQARLTPSIKRESIIGVRMPLLRNFAKTFIKTDECAKFLSELPHEYYDENMLHGIILSSQRDFDTAIKLTESFLPYIDNWATCDTISPKAFQKNKERLLPYLQGWIQSKEVYTCRFGIEMLMSFYLDDDFKKEYLEYPLRVESEEYYVNMMIAWFFATALAKQWNDTIPVIENRVLPKWTHNKTIQKAKESNRITPEQKAYLSGLKMA